MILIILNQKNHKTMKKFMSQIMRGGYWLTPYVIEINDTHVMYSKRTIWLVNRAETSIELNRVSCVNTYPSIIGTDVLIESYGEGSIHAKNFSLDDAKEIKKIIEGHQKENKSERK